jgi:hypothetical protein
MREPARPRLSGWCSPCCSPRAHATCQDRLDRQLLTRCECPGHEKKAT